MARGNAGRGGKRRSGAYRAAKTAAMVAVGLALASALDPEWLTTAGVPAAEWFDAGAEGGVGQHRRLGGGMAHVLFGAADYLPLKSGACSMLIVVAAVIATEAGFEALNHVTHDSPFEDLIHAIENELMIVGFMAFLLKIVLNLTTIPSDWLLSLEYADLVVPIITFIRCGVGIGLIVMCIKVCDHWGKAYHLHHLLVMEAYLDHSKQWYSRGHWSWLPISWTNGAMEFRIFHNIFCEHFKIQRSAFAFDEYVHLIFEKFLLRIIGMHEVDWLFVCVFTLLNWLRLQYGLDVHECLRDEDSAKYCKSIYMDCDCHQVAALEDFTIAGFAVLGFAIALAFTSRLYELRVMAKRGVMNSDGYAAFLDAAEQDAERLEHSHRKEHRRFNAETLKAAVSRVKQKAEEARAKAENWWLSLILDNSHECFITLTCPACMLRRDREHPWHRCGRYASHAVVTELDDAGIKKKKKKGPAGSHRRSLRVALAHVHEEAIITKEAAAAAAALSASPSVHHSTLQGPADSELSGQRPEDSLDSIFFFHSPGLYFDSVAVTMMPISFHLALWLTNFVSAATEIYSGQKKIYWQLLSLCPGLLAAFVYAYSVRVASLLQAVTQIDHDAVEVSCRFSLPLCLFSTRPLTTPHPTTPHHTSQEVLEQTEGAKVLQMEMREKILEKLEEIGDPREELRTLFSLIDFDGTGLLSRAEFQLFLNELNINFSRRKWSQIFAEIDKDNSDELDFDELLMFVFADTAEVKAMERARIAEIEKQVSSKAHHMLTEQREKAAARSSKPSSFSSSAPDAGAAGAGAGADTDASGGAKFLGAIGASMRRSFTGSSNNNSEFILTALADTASRKIGPTSRASGGGGGGELSKGESPTETWTLDEVEQHAFEPNP